MLMAAIEAAQGVEQGLSALSSAQHPKDAQRAAAAQAALPRAVAGDLSQAQYILAQRFHSATAYGKQQFAIAWAALQQQNPQIAVQAQQTALASPEISSDPSARSQISGELTALLAKIRQDVGTTVQQIGAGVATGAASAIDPNTGRVTLPVSSSTIWVMAAIAIVIAVLVFLPKRRAG